MKADLQPIEDRMPAIRLADFQKWDIRPSVMEKVLREEQLKQSICALNALFNRDSFTELTSKRLNSCSECGREHEPI